MDETESTMEREDIIKLVLWTMKYYGSDAGERKEPGSKLRSQAEHIADVLAEYDEAQMRLGSLQHFRVVMWGHDL
jgi:hypothetical protein